MKPHFWLSIDPREPSKTHLERFWAKLREKLSSASVSDKRCADPLFSVVFFCFFALKTDPSGLSRPHSCGLCARRAPSHVRLFACRLGSFDPGMRRHTGYVVPAVLEDGNKGFFVYVYPTGWYAPCHLSLGVLSSLTRMVPMESGCKVCVDHSGRAGSRGTAPFSCPASSPSSSILTCALSMRIRWSKGTCLMKRARWLGTLLPTSGTVAMKGI